MRAAILIHYTVGGCDLLLYSTHRSLCYDINHILMANDVYYTFRRREPVVELDHAERVNTRVRS